MVKVVRNQSLVTLSMQTPNAKVYDVVIIGGGPAGLTAAIYTSRAAASTLILGGILWGGQLMLTTAVDNFPGFPEGIEGPDLMGRMKSQAERFGVEFKALDVTKVDFVRRPFEVYSGEEWFLSRSVIIATGATTVWLDAPGVKEYIGRGVSSCAPCDAPFFKDKKVAVIGGGDSAMEEAYYLSKFASKVTIVHRRDAFRATAAMQEKIKSNQKIDILWDSEVVKVEGGKTVKSLSLRNNKTQEISKMAVDGVFIAIGHTPQSDLFKGLLEMDERGFVKVIGGHSKTSLAGIFVAGDVFDSEYKQAVTAAGSGCAAAMDALKYLEDNK